MENKINISEQNEYALCFVANDAVIDDLIVCLKSFFETNEHKNVDIVILCDKKYCKINEFNRNKISSICENVIFHEVNHIEYEPIFRKWEENNVNWKFYPVFYKFECFDMSQYKTVVWLDTDILILSDISFLFTGNTYGIMGVVDKEDNEIFKYITTDSVYPYSENNYINVGVISISNEFLCKKNELIQFTIEFPIGLYAPLPYKYSGIYPEQDVLNMYLKCQKNNVVVLPYAYNAMAYFISINNMQNYFESVKILHYACGLTKKENCINELQNKMFMLRKKYEEGNNI